MRMRPIFITSLTLMAGAFAILQDPIFNGMAISLLFGAGVATVMALLIVPLGCISAKKQFYVETADDGTVAISRSFQLIEHVDEEAEAAEKAARTPLLMRIWGGIFSIFSWDSRRSSAGLAEEAGRRHHPGAGHRRRHAEGVLRHRRVSHLPVVHHRRRARNRPPRPARRHRRARHRPPRPARRHRRARHRPPRPTRRRARHR
jgi:hypothetical protein